MMRTLFAALALAFVLGLQVTPALASCTTHTYWLPDRMVWCRICCQANGNCTTTCL